MKQLAGRPEPPATAAAALALVLLGVGTSPGDSGSPGDVLGLTDAAAAKESALLVTFSDSGSHRDVLDLIDAAAAALPADTREAGC